MNFRIYFYFFFFFKWQLDPHPLLYFLMTTPTPYDRIIIYDNNNRFCRDEYKYNTRTLQCVFEKQERKSVWVYALDLYILATENIIICKSFYQVIAITSLPSHRG